MNLRLADDRDVAMAASSVRMHWSPGQGAPCVRCGLYPMDRSLYSYWVARPASEGGDGLGWAPLCDLAPWVLARMQHPSQARA